MESEHPGQGLSVGLKSTLTVSPTGDGGQGEGSGDLGEQYRSSSFSIPYSLLQAPPLLLGSY